MGTDQIGRDYFSRLIYAGRISLTVAIISVLISELIGIIVGAISGFFGGWIDSVLMRFVEFMLTIPTLPLLLIISAMLLRDENLIPIPEFILNFMGNLLLLTPRDSRSAVLIILILSGFGWLSAAQLMRGMVLSLREQTFVEASRSLGASNFRIISRDMIPNAMAPIIVDASLGLAGYIVGEAALAFLGFGIQDPIPTWGNMLSASQEFMLDRPWLPLVPGFPIFICSLAFNYIGDGLRDALDPRLKL
jgi:peptide/nickel transport system permease protein